MYGLYAQLNILSVFDCYHHYCMFNVCGRKAIVKYTVVILSHPSHYNLYLGTISTYSKIMTVLFSFLV